MLEIMAMSGPEVDETLGRISCGYLACACDGRPYVVPISYVYAKPHILIYATGLLNAEIVTRDPFVSVHVKEISGDGMWKSIVVTGHAAAITDGAEREKAIWMIGELTPLATPSAPLLATGDRIKEDTDVLYKLTIKTAAGLSSTNVRMLAASARRDAAAKKR